MQIPKRWVQSRFPRRSSQFNPGRIELSPDPSPGGIGIPTHRDGVTFIQAGRTYLPFVGALLMLAIIFTACSGRSTLASSTDRALEAYSAEVTKGAWLYVENACVQCHGLGGRGGTAIRPAGPSLISAEFKRTFPKDQRFDAALANLIRNGSIINGDGAASMPAWNGILSDEEVGSIVAYIRAGLPDLDVPIPPAKTGKDIYTAFACAKCHGEIATGGIRNLGAETPAHKTIPPVGGVDFRKKFDTKEKLRDVILSGRLVENGRVGAVYMPSWGKIGTADQIENVIDYIWDASKP